MNSKNSKKKRSGNSSKKNNRGKSNCRKATSSNKTKKIKQEYVLGDAHEDFIFERRAKSVSYRKVADQLVKAEEFPEIKSVDHTTVFDFFKKREERYQGWIRDDDCKKIRLANRIARILELQQMVEKLGESILDIIATVAKSQWDAIHLSALIKQYRELLAQIQDESGDKVHKVKAEGITGDLVFGDKVINAFADKTVQARVKETTDPGNRFKALRLPDTGSSLSDN